MNYYSLKQALEVFKKDLPTPLLPFDLPQIADLCRQGKLTPVFPYQGFISAPVDYDDNGRPIHATGAIEPYDSYLHSNKLINLMDGYVDKLELWTASTPQGGHDLDFYSRPMRHTDDDIEPITFTVRLENILLKVDDVQNYITLQYFDDLTTPEQQRIIELESEVTALKKQLRQQADTPANDDTELSTRSQNLAAKIILSLLDTAQLDRNSPPYQYDNPSSNNSIIHDQLKAKGMKVSPQKIGYWLDLAIKQTTDD
ncbi:hypothetical protein H0262_06715 [Psychrobacter cryohalolentis]|uniref:hypothetical protein n=1 Tax=Psychrobacter sp. D2 TaxID=2759702 RepID=UPI0015E5A675|nr:hypothetical protein [Psychrobacter sp. D2]MBA2057571.1 hypothetical protein [Psychrobacter sp. D2]